MSSEGDHQMQQQKLKDDKENIFLKSLDTLNLDDDGHNHLFENDDHHVNNHIQIQV